MSSLAQFTFGLLLLTASALPAGEFQKTSPEQVRISGQAIADCEQLIHGQIKDGELAGIIVAVLRGGRVAHMKAYGYRDAMNKVPARTDDIVRIYSMSKPIVSAAAMQLWEQGKFQLDDPIAKYIPAFTRMQVLVSENDKPPRLLIGICFLSTIRNITAKIGAHGDYLSLMQTERRPEAAVQNLENPASALALTCLNESSDNNHGFRRRRAS